MSYLTENATVEMSLRSYDDLSSSTALPRYQPRATSFDLGYLVREMSLHGEDDEGTEDDMICDDSEVQDCVQYLSDIMEGTRQLVADYSHLPFDEEQEMAGHEDNRTLLYSGDSGEEDGSSIVSPVLPLYRVDEAVEESYFPLLAQDSTEEGMEWPEEESPSSLHLRAKKDGEEEEAEE